MNETHIGGFTLSYRDKWNNPVFRNLLEAAIWGWMCETATWKDTKIRFNGNLIKLSRGQLATSVRFVSKGFELSERATRTLFKNLENDLMIDTRPTHWGTIITICNYDKYQHLNLTTDTPIDTRPTHARHTGDTNKKEIKKLNNINNNNNSTTEHNLSAKPPTMHDDAFLREFYSEVQDVIGSPVPLNLSPVQGWIDCGALPREDVLETIRYVIGKLKTQGKPPPNSIMYFAQAVADAKHRRLMGLPPPSGEGGSQAALDRIDAQIAEMLQQVEKQG